MIGVGEALAAVLDAVSGIGVEQVALPAAAGRVLAAPVTSTGNVPPFRNAAMDGFAVRAADVAVVPVRLRVLETVGAGDVASQPVVADTAIRIMTGAPMPDGADAVVRVEDTSETAGGVEVSIAVAAGANVRHPGEDLEAGELVLDAGRALRPADIGLLASAGAATVTVRRRPRVAILATGDELVELGQPLAPGQIVNSNAYTLAAAVEAAGGVPVVLGIVRDTLAETHAAFADALGADMVLSTGGVSVGKFDYVRQVLETLGYAERFWKVAQKPGKPLTFGLCDATPVFGLPGNPVSALVCFQVYVRAALRAMQGLTAVHLPWTWATMGDTVRIARGLTEFVRGALEGEPGAYTVRSTGSQSSGVLRSMSRGDGLVVGAADREQLGAGERVKVLLLDVTGGSATPPV